jgi:hypothetical protein
LIPTCIRKLSKSCRRQISLPIHHSSHPKCIFICISFILQTFQEKVSKYKIACFVLFIFFTFHKLLLLFSAKFLSFIFQLNFIIIAVLLLLTTVFTNKNYFFYKLIVNLFVCVRGYIYIFFSFLRVAF